jgi:hypothetical protein
MMTRQGAAATLSKSIDVKETLTKRFFTSMLG